MGSMGLAGKSHFMTIQMNIKFYIFLTFTDIDGEEVKKRILREDDSVTLINRSSVQVQSFCTFFQISFSSNLVCLGPQLSISANTLIWV